MLMRLFYSSAVLMGCLYFFIFPAYSYLQWGAGVVPRLPFNILVFLVSTVVMLLAVAARAKLKYDSVIILFYLVVFFGFFLALLGFVDIVSAGWMAVVRVYYIYFVLIMFVPLICLFWSGYFGGASKRYLSFDIGVFFGSAIFLVTSVLYGVYLGYMERGVLRSVYQIPGNPQMYLLLSNAVVILGLMLVAHSLSYFRYFIFAVVVLLLVFTLSRSSLFFFVVSFFFMEYYHGRRIGPIALLLGIVMLLMFNLNAINDIFYRYSVLFVDRSEDASYLARIEMYNNGLGVIFDNILFGSFGYEVVRDGGTGGYIHNALSYLASYGVLYFLLLNILVGVTLFRVFSRRNMLLDPIGSFCVGYFIYSVLSYVFTKAYTWPDIFISIALLNTYVLARAREGSFSRSAMLSP